MKRFKRCSAPRFIGVGVGAGEQSHFKPSNPTQLTKNRSPQFASFWGALGSIKTAPRHLGSTGEHGEHSSYLDRF